MPFLLLIVLILTSLQREWPAPPEWFGWPGSVLLTWGVVALFSSAAWLAAWRGQRQLQRDTADRARVQARYAIFRRWHVYLLFVAHILLVCLGGWGWLVGAEAMVHGDLVTPGIDLLLTLPLIAALFLSWACYQPLENALALSRHMESEPPFPRRWGFVVMQARHHFLLVGPPLVLMFLQQLLLAAWPSEARTPLAASLLGLGLVAGMYAGIPSILRFLLGLKPLPPGPLRDRLLATAKRLSFRCSDILVWNTRCTIVNAMVTGPLPILRYVILTDRLIDESAPEEIEAVFGHEVGHIKHHHLFFYFGFLLASMVVVLGLWNVLANATQLEAWFRQHWPAAESWLASYHILSALPLVGFMGAYIVIVFGFLSRHCERQADIYGCHTVSVPVFIEALEKVARLNGISRDRPGWLLSWQHSTIALRVAFLERMDVDPALEARFQRRVRFVKWGLLLSLAVVIALLGPQNVRAVLGMLGN